mmetsp:Transcript_27293/g.84583  ORF Transcript_27293/g.84583 Transcript_27293/m.84583 type:complete len:267 (-) Transcript_27293:273-1073(-)
MVARSRPRSSVVVDMDAGSWMATSGALWSASHAGQRSPRVASSWDASTSKCHPTPFASCRSSRSISRGVTPTARAKFATGGRTSCKSLAATKVAPISSRCAMSMHTGMPVVASNRCSSVMPASTVSGETLPRRRAKRPAMSLLSGVSGTTPEWKWVRISKLGAPVAASLRSTRTATARPISVSSSMSAGRRSTASHRRCSSTRAWRTRSVGTNGIGSHDWRVACSEPAGGMTMGEGRAARLFLGCEDSAGGLCRDTRKLLFWVWLC